MDAGEVLDVLGDDHACSAAATATTSASGRASTPRSRTCTCTASCPRSSRSSQVACGNIWSIKNRTAYEAMSHRVTVHRPAARDCRTPVRETSTVPVGPEADRRGRSPCNASRPACAASSRSAPVSAGALGDQDTREPECATKTATEAEGGSGSVRAPGTPGQPHLRRSERCQRRRWDLNPRDAQSRLPVFKTGAFNQTRPHLQRPTSVGGVAGSAARVPTCSPPVRLLVDVGSGLRPGGFA